MMLIDTHAHLYLPHFNDDIDRVIGNAKMNNVGRILMPNIDIRSVDPMLRVCSRHPGFCLPMLGLHPTSVKDNYAGMLKTLEDLLDKENFAAIGETGMDAHWDTSFMEQQKRSFITHLEWAEETGLPVVIHSRKTMDTIIGILKNAYSKKVTGVFHAFSGSEEQAREITGMGFMLGIGGVVTYPRSGLEEVLSKIELEHIILETDAPYLTPVPFRGKRNESAHLVYIVEKIAEIKGLTIEQVAEVTTGNARRLFKLKRE